MLGISGARWARYVERAPSATLSELGGGGESTLLFVYRAEDCESYAALPERWRRLSDLGAVRVVGVPLGDDPARGEGDHPPAEETSPFPLEPALAGAAEILMLRLGFDRTPVSILLDGEGRVRMVIPPAGAASAREAGGVVERYARSLMVAEGGGP
jgi:hypothetical protein